jgi:hypothetical protein
MVGVPAAVVELLRLPLFARINLREGEIFVAATGEDIKSTPYDVDEGAKVAARGEVAAA